MEIFRLDAFYKIINILSLAMEIFRLDAPYKIINILSLAMEIFYLWPWKYSVLMHLTKS
jgi:hypothetical protein